MNYHSCLCLQTTPSLQLPTCCVMQWLESPAHSLVCSITSNSMTVEFTYKNKEGRGAWEQDAYVITYSSPNIHSPITWTTHIIISLVDHKNIYCKPAHNYAQAYTLWWHIANIHAQHLNEFKRKHKIIEPLCMHTHIQLVATSPCIM